jgi:hypothetical protein
MDTLLVHIGLISNTMRTNAKKTKEGGKSRI